MSSNGSGFFQEKNGLTPFFPSILISKAIMEHNNIGLPINIESIMAFIQIVVMKSARLIYQSTLKQISKIISYPLTREALFQAQNQWLQYPGLFDLTFPPVSLFVRNYMQLRLLRMEKVSQSMLFSLEKALEKLPPSLGLFNVELWVERHLMTLKE